MNTRQDQGTAPRKVLFFSQDGKLGDAIVNTAFVAALHRAAPACEIHVTVAGATTSFWGADPRIHRLWTLQCPGWSDTVRTGLAMRRERFDYIVTWQPLRKEKNKLLLWLANAGKVIDLRAYHAGPLRHKVEACGAVLAEMGLAPGAELRYDIGMTACCANIDQLLPAGPEVMLLNLFAADAERTIAPEQAEAMLVGLRQIAPEAQLCLVCTDATAPRALAVLAASGVAGEVVNCDGDLPRLLRLCQRADLTISPDTALIHIASAYQRAVVGIYQNNGEKSVLWGPRTRLEARVLSGDPHSIAGFDVEEVLRAVCTLRAGSGYGAGD